MGSISPQGGDGRWAVSTGGVGFHGRTGRFPGMQMPRTLRVGPGWLRGSARSRKMQGDGWCAPVAGGRQGCQPLRCPGGVPATETSAALPSPPAPAMQASPRRSPGCAGNNRGFCRGGRDVRIASVHAEAVAAARMVASAHVVAPALWRNRASSCTRAMAPDAPMGWPRASPPPQALRRDGSTPCCCRAWAKASPCTAKASCSSTASSCRAVACSRASSAAAASQAPVRGVSGSVPSARPACHHADGCRPCWRQARSEASRTRAAPSAWGDTATRESAQSGPSGAAAPSGSGGSAIRMGMRCSCRSDSGRG